METGTCQCLPLSRTIQHSATVEPLPMIPDSKGALLRTQGSASCRHHSKEYRMQAGRERVGIPSMGRHWTRCLVIDTVVRFHLRYVSASAPPSLTCCDAIINISYGYFERPFMYIIPSPPQTCLRARQAPLPISQRGTLRLREAMRTLHAAVCPRFQPALHTASRAFPAVCLSIPSRRMQPEKEENTRSPL